jgi:hypothetical protein
MASIIQKDRDEARATLLSMLKPGDTVKTILRHVSASGMSRTIDLIVIGKSWDNQPTIRSIGWLAGRLGVAAWDDKRQGLKISGCGMDMGFELVYRLGHQLWPDGFPCAGKKRCRANDHVNPGPNRDRYGRGVKHKDAGYALKQEWL